MAAAILRVYACKFTKILIFFLSCLLNKCTLIGVHLFIYFFFSLKKKKYTRTRAKTDETQAYQGLQRRVYLRV